MDTRNTLSGWLFLELALLMPALLTGVVFILRRWIFQAFAIYPQDAYLGAVVYPFIGAVVGGVVALGISDFFNGDAFPGIAYVFAGMGIATFTGGAIAKDQAKAEQAPPDYFSVEEWRRDVDYLNRLRRISREERREFAQRAQQLADRGKQACEEARLFRFRTYWRGRRRRARMFAYIWVAIGVYLAAHQSSVMKSPWYLAGSVAGGSMIFAAWFRWYDERMVKNAEGNAQIRASELILQRLQRLPDIPAPSLRQRLATLIFPHAAVPS